MPLRMLVGACYLSIRPLVSICTGFPPVIGVFQLLTCFLIWKKQKENVNSSEVHGLFNDCINQEEEEKKLQKTQVAF